MMTTLLIQDLMTLIDWDDLGFDVIAKGNHRRAGHGSLS